MARCRARVDRRGGRTVPGVNPDANDYLINTIKDMQRRLAALETQPALNNAAVSGGQLTIQDGNYKPVVVLGKQADGTYGLRWFDTSGHLLGGVGQAPDATHGIFVDDATGATLLKVTSENGQTFPRALIPCVTGSGFLSGSASQGFRPGTTSATFVPIWVGRFSSVGPTVDYDITAYANAGNMSWQITCNEFGMGDVVVVGPNTETTNVGRSGTFTLGASNIASGTDPAGRQMVFKVWARINSGATTGDVVLNNIPTNRSS